MRISCLSILLCCFAWVHFSYAKEVGNEEDHHASVRQLQFGYACPTPPPPPTPRPPTTPTTGQGSTDCCKHFHRRLGGTKQIADAQCRCSPSSPTPRPRPAPTRRPPTSTHFVPTKDNCGGKPCNHHIRQRDLLRTDLQHVFTEPEEQEDSLPGTDLQEHNIFEEPISPTIRMTRPCVLVLMESQNEDGSTEDEWQCELDEDDVDGDEDEMIDLPGLTIDPDDETIISGSTTFFVPSMAVDLEEGAAIATPQVLARGQLGSIDPGFHARRHLYVTGSRSVLVVRCNTRSGYPTDSMEALSNLVFGTSVGQVNLKSRIEACSYSELCITPASGGGIQNGVVNVWVRSESNGEKRQKIRRKCIRKAKGKIGRRAFKRFHHVMVVIPSGTKDSARWAASSTISHYQSVFNDIWIRQVSMQIRAFGSNLGIRTAGDRQNGISASDDVRGDGTSLMGDGLNAIKCFNGPHSWFLGWYRNRHLIIDVDNRFFIQQDVVLEGIASYTVGSGPPVILRIPSNAHALLDWYIMYNHAVGVNAGTEDGRNAVTVVGGNDRKANQHSFLVKTMKNNWETVGLGRLKTNVKVTLLEINGATARIRVEVD